MSLLVLSLPGASSPPLLLSFVLIFTSAKIMPFGFGAVKTTQKMRDDSPFVDDGQKRWGIIDLGQHFILPYSSNVRRSAK